MEDEEKRGPGRPRIEKRPEVDAMLGSQDHPTGNINGPRNVPQDGEAEPLPAIEFTVEVKHALSPDLMRLNVLGKNKEDAIERIKEHLKFRVEKAKPINYPKNPQEKTEE